MRSVKSGATLVDHSYTLDPVGNPTQVVRAGSAAGTTTYDYDARDRLTEVCYQSSCPGGSDPFIRWTYDSVGNRLTETRSAGMTSYSYNDADELTQAGTTTYAYDTNGNQTTAGTRTFAYDLAGRLISTNQGGATTTYAYDGNGTRLEAETGTNAVDRTEYLTDPNFELPQIALERDGSQVLMRRYIYGMKRIAQTTSSSSSYMSYDGLGSVVNVSSSTGAKEWTFSYEPFGAAKLETQEQQQAPMAPMRFAGEYQDATGLYHLRARQYDPLSARFTQRDPVESAPSEPCVSAYVYASNRPTVLIDPSGKTFVASDAGQSSAAEVGRNLSALGPDAAVPARISCGVATVNVRGFQLGPQDLTIHTRVFISIKTATQRPIESYQGAIALSAFPSYFHERLFRGVASPLQRAIHVVPQYFEIPEPPAILGEVFFAGYFRGTLAGGKRSCFTHFEGFAPIQPVPWLLP